MGVNTWNDLVLLIGMNHLDDLGGLGSWGSTHIHDLLSSRTIILSSEFIP